MGSFKEMVLIVSIFSACVLTILATFFAVLNQKAIGDGALYSLQSATIFTDMAARCGWAMHSVPKVRNQLKKVNQEWGTENKEWESGTIAVAGPCTLFQKSNKIIEK
jgi:hypothetical protein